MKKLYLPFLLILVGSSLLAQTPLPYFTGFDNSSQQAGWTEYKLGVNSDPYKWEVGTVSPYSAPNSLVHYYPVGGSQQTDDWYVSPQFDFTLGATIDSLRYAFSGFGTPMAGDTIAIYLLNGSQDPAQAASIDMIYSFTDSTYLNDNTWRKIDPINLLPVSGSSYIAFRYSTTNNWLDVRLDNLAINGENVGLKENKAEQKAVSLYPNPAKGILKIDLKDKTGTDQKLSLKLYNTTGKLVMAQDIFDATQLVVDQLHGVFLYEVYDARQNLLSRGKIMCE